MSTYLPEEVVAEILARLPVVSLLRFKCICRSWYALIRNPNFVSMHSKFMENEDNNSRFLILRRPIGNDKPAISLISVTDENETVEEDDVVDLLDYPIHEPQDRFFLPFVLLGPCNCIYLFGVPYTLFNPATRELKMVPKSHTRHKHGTWIESTGFGFDPKSNDYKIITFFWPQPGVRDNPGTFRRSPDVEVYSLNNDSWKNLEGVPPAIFSVWSESNACFKGVCYWWASVTWYCDSQILSFDMGDEVFQITPLPSVFPKPGYGKFGLYYESLALVLQRPGCFDIWVVNTSGTDWSWTKQFSIQSLQSIERSVGFGKNGVVFWEKSDEQIFLSRPHSKFPKKFGVQGCKYSVHVVRYEESLVSVK